MACFLGKKSPFSCILNVILFITLCYSTGLVYQWTCKFFQPIDQLDQLPILDPQSTRTDNHLIAAHHNLIINMDIDQPIGFTSSVTNPAVKWIQYSALFLQALCPNFTDCP